ncbi:hypothetical protein BFX40_09250 [Mesorhizobium sp. SEMIA 3007]|uniref:hypothetical protein n=1 Tax=Mesorhizobium sp. SEMIA 3007 TaxID=1862350 RepID=UPI00083DE54C|nr:hypothetical protein [Mesorhizobium sp. SEMIA 3007]ODA93070.1 hypothetical protein BFX40_09250 [Mesorhizobium sp. SEMIA 3007]
MSGNLVESIIKRDGPCLSTELARKLESQGLTPEAARKRISRGTGGVHRLAGLVFPRGVRFFYHESDYNGERYWTALAHAVSVASPAYGPALAALRARGGIVPREHFSIISGSPILQRGQVASNTVLERLEAVKLISTVNVEGVGECVALGAKGFLGRADISRLPARLLTEKILLLAVRDWARRLGMASYDKITLRNDGALPRFGTFNWDLCGPTYLSPMVRYDKARKRQPGFLVCDAVVGEIVDEVAIAAFVRKCRLSAAMRNLPPLMPLMIADRFTREAFRLGKSRGIIMATPYTLFGKDVAIGLATLLRTLSKAAAVAVGKPEVMIELFDRLGQIEGAAGNLRGALFEMLVGHSTHATDGGSIDIGRRVASSDGFKAEIDVLRVKSHESWVYECKGYQPDHMIGGGEVKEWLEKKVPGIYATLRGQEGHASKAIHFEFWTTGGFSAEAVAILDEAAKRTRRYTVGYLAGPGVRSYVAKLQVPGLTKMLDEHYFNHPISRFNRKYDAVASFDAISPSTDLGFDDIDDVALEDLDLETLGDMEGDDEAL